MNRVLTVMTANELISRVKNLVPVSPAALNLVGLLNQPGIGNDDVVSVLKFDNVLTAKLLRACNSPFFGLAEPVSSVEQAVFILGHQQILHVALSIAFSSIMNSPSPGYAAEAKTLWEHSLITALAAENIAKENSRFAGEPSVAFTAGLLHDIGKIVLSHALTHDQQTNIQSRAMQTRLSRTTAEKQVLGLDHAEVGRCLLQSWRLPDNILEAVGNHHHPVSRPRPELSSVVNVADGLAWSIDSEQGWETFTVQADADAVEALEITPETLDGLTASARDSMNQVENLMKVG
jgi:putative nucleotidyltransferase with HDIG domain